jgi:hypothetical protein
MCSSTIFLHLTQNHIVSDFDNTSYSVFDFFRHFIQKCSLQCWHSNNLASDAAKFWYKVYNPKDHQLRPWILNCILCSAIFLPLTARSDKASLSDLNFVYLFLCIGLPYTLQLIIRASLIKIRL